MRTPVASIAFALTFAAGAVGQLHTDRPDPRALDLPAGDDAFTFVIFGDRTGGPAAGIKVLAQAVDDTVLLDPDLVMTVGDLINGYNEREPWMRQMNEYQETMAKLTMPWFPVAGNHDVYWRGPGRPPEEHEGDYERHFGPLWYAFPHKGCWFVVLYSDEGDPETGERNFNKASCQRMSDEQLSWLRATLGKAKDARHVFVFLHHPRWLEGRYGEDWRKVHRVLADAGNVRAVFAGHIHRMRYDGKVDGIEYFTLATVGGHLTGPIPGAGFLHQLHHVTVRDEGIQVACLPVGTVMDPRRITGEVSQDVARIHADLAPEIGPRLEMGPTGDVDGVLRLSLTNPSSRPIEVSVSPMTGDRRWTFQPDHVHQEVAAGDSWSLTMRVTRIGGGLGPNLALPEVEVGVDYLREGLRVALPPRRVAVDTTPPPFAPSRRAEDRVLDVGRGRVLAVSDVDLDLPDGALTVEGWLNARALEGRRGFLNKTENSEFGLFVDDGQPSFMVHLGGRYVEAKAPAALLGRGEWHHLAGVFDGAEVRLYVDGRRVASAAGSGMRGRNGLPFYVGADTDVRGKPTSEVEGLIDEVRVSSTARYRTERFEPKRRFQPDSATVLLLKMDETRGPWLLDSSERRRHPRLVGGARLVEPRRQPGG